ncbi:hypothetical protein BHM34_17350 [Salmonella enterica subsp. enterica serovar Toucra]|nr:hypothetical protein [Salmonella enterica subsp. enterica serovar Blockley]ECU7993236.1 hypothetical protein [Salmonella enterica subsp. enterica serovar Toucra]
MNTNIADNRRRRLREWFAGKNLPPLEKSYLSQLMTGRASFGERAARRIERDYGMPEGHLDIPLHIPGRDRKDYDRIKKLTDQQREFLSLLDKLPTYEINKLLEEMREKCNFYEAIVDEFLEKRRKNNNQND